MLEEWKQNVLLYIDQDKRGFDRIKMFLTINAGLFVIYGILWNNLDNPLSKIAGVILSITALYITNITWSMSKRAHAFILLRVRQGMFIEDKLKQLLSPNKKWSSDSGIITTFTREHVAFQSEEDIEKELPYLLPLKKEFKKFCNFASAPFYFKGIFKESIGHLQWLKLMHFTLGILWLILGISIAISSFVYIPE